MKETKRILKKDSFAIHFIDLSDHFQHQDKSITRINFLRYSDKQWERIAGNQFAYCNRLGASDYLALFKDSGFDVYRHKTQKDDKAVQSIKDGFLVDKLLSDYSINDICNTQLKVAVKIRKRES